MLLFILGGVSFSLLIIRAAGGGVMVPELGEESYGIVNIDDSHYTKSEVKSKTTGYVSRAKYDRLTAAASNLLAKHKLNAVIEADVRWMETELESIATKPNN